MCVCVCVCVCVYVRSALTYNYYEYDQDDDNEDNPQLHILPPQLALQSGGSSLEHVSILVQVL